MSASTLVTKTPLQEWTIPAVGAVRRFAESNAGVCTAAMAALLVVGDFVTGVEIAATLLYLVPLSLAAWYRGRPLGIAIALFCSCSALAVEVTNRLHHRWPLHPFHLVWNHGGSFAIFVIVVHLVVRLRAYADKESRERRLAVEQLRQAERLGVVGKLAAGLAHELGTPLNVILGHAELLESDRVTDQVIHTASATIIAQTQKMSAIIRGLLDFSRRPGVQRSDVDLDELAQNAAAILRPIARKTGVEIEIASRGDGRTLVNGNQTELEQVFVNLMMNGIQAMPSGGTLRVRVSPRVHDPDESPGSVPPPSVACVEVEDEGVGIPPESLPKVFDPFFTTKDVGEGTGLGLAVSYGIVSDHGGRIHVSSSLGSGSRFSVYVPLSKGSS